MVDAETKKRALAFIEAIEVACEEHGFDLLHEDPQGRFVVRPASSGRARALRRRGRERQVGIPLIRPYRLER
jgi:hypothetical protein